MGKRMPETCWAVFERRAINPRDWYIWLVGWLIYFKIFIHYATTQTALWSKQKVFFQDTQQCTPLLPKQGPLLVCYWNPQPHSAYNSHKIGKYNFINLFTVGATLNTQNVLRYVVAAEVTNFLREHKGIFSPYSRIIIPTHISLERIQFIQSAIFRVYPFISYT
jgi:hypothetical protein